jgi:hypothetical protein
VPPAGGVPAAGPDDAAALPWWRTPAARWAGIGVAAVAVGTVAAVAVAGVLTPDGGTPAAGPSPSVGNMQLTVPDETHEVTLEVTATGKDAATTEVGVRYDGRLGPSGLADSFRSAEDVMEMDPDKLYTEVELPWSRTITAQGTVDGANITLSAEAGWRDRMAMLTGDTDIAVSCRILIDGKVVVDEAGQVNVGCMLLPPELQEQMDKMREESEKLAQEQTEEQQEQQENLPEPGTPEFQEYVENLLDKAGQAQDGNG